MPNQTADGFQIKSNCGEPSNCLSSQAAVSVWVWFKLPSELLPIHNYHLKIFEGTHLIMSL
jgi:hypothetical protein